MDGMYAGQGRRHHRSRDFVDELAETRIFLWGPSDNGKGVDGVFLAEDLFHLEVREIVPSGIVTDVVAEGAFRFQLWSHFSQNTKFGIARDQVAVVLEIAEPLACEHPRERQFRKVFGHGRNRCNRVRQGAADKDAHLERPAFFDGLLVVCCDIAVNLVVKPAFIGGVVVPGNLDAVHAQVRLQDAALFAGARRDQRQCDERPAVFGPADNLREVGEGAFLEIVDGAVAHGQRIQPCFCRLDKLRRANVRKEPPRVRLEVDGRLRRFQRIAEQELHPLARAENVGGRLEPASLHFFEQQRRPAVIISLPCDFGHLEIRIHFFVDALEHACSF